MENTLESLFKKKDQKATGADEKEKKSELGKATEIKSEINTITGGESLEDLDLEVLKKVLEKYKEMQNVLGISESEPASEVPARVEQAKEVMGSEFFGSREVEKAFGIKVRPEDIPEIPFSREDLERARKLNQFLVLRVDKAPDGKPLTLQKINEILKGKVKGEKKLLYSDDGTGKIKGDSWYKNEDFPKSDVPKLAWALVSKEVILNSTSKNYLNQTEEIVNYLKNEVFKGKEIPKVYQEAIAEFEKEKEAVGELMSSDWKKAAEKLSQLKINQLTRQNPAEVLYDIAIYFQNKEERVLENRYAWTTRRDSDGELVGVGRFDSDGVFVARGTPVGSHDNLGVCVSRSL